MAEPDRDHDANSPGGVVRAMADQVSRKALDLADGTDKRVAEIIALADSGFAQLKQALERFQQHNRAGAAALSEAVTDQFNALAQKVDDLTLHCRAAADSFDKHHGAIVNGLAALQPGALNEPAAGSEQLPTTEARSHDIIERALRRSPS